MIAKGTNDEKKLARDLRVKSSVEDELWHEVLPGGGKGDSSLCLAGDDADANNGETTGDSDYDYDVVVEEDDDGGLNLNEPTSDDKQVWGARGSVEEVATSKKPILDLHKDKGSDKITPPITDQDGGAGPNDDQEQGLGAVAECDLLVLPWPAPPPTVHWRLLAECKRTYTATLPGVRNFEKLLSSFTACVQEMHVPVAWMRCRQLHLLSNTLQAGTGMPLLSLPSSAHSTVLSLTAPAHLRQQHNPVCEKIIVVAKDSLAGPVTAFLRSVYKPPDVFEVLGTFEGITVASIEVALVLPAHGSAAGSGKATGASLAGGNNNKPPLRGAPPPLGAAMMNMGAPASNAASTIAADKKVGRLLFLLTLIPSVVAVLINAICCCYY